MLNGFNKKTHRIMKKHEIKVEDIEKEDVVEKQNCDETLQDAEQQATAEENDETPEQDAANEEEEAAEPTVEEKLEAAEQEIARVKDMYLRSVAEFDNYRRRTMKEKAEIILNGGARVIENLLPILDDLERAEANTAEDADVETLRQGLDLISKKLIDTLTHQGLKRMETIGKDFDTDFHEAVALVPTEDADKKGKVIDCISTGYMLGDRVLRHAKVAVGQ